VPRLLQRIEPELEPEVEKVGAVHFGHGAEGSQVSTQRPILNVTPRGKLSCPPGENSVL
jgi:hypothetical protein